MDWLKRITYMAVGALLVALVAFGVATFAQDDDDVETPDAESEEPAGDDRADESTEDDEAELTVPGLWRDGRPANHDEYLADALGISVDELQAAYEETQIAAIEQAVEEGILTEEQADELLDRVNGFHGRFRRGFRFGGIDEDALLAEALDISVEALEAARVEASRAKLDAMVEAGALTQEEADLMAAREAVGTYFDQEAVAAIIQEAYESAVTQALEEGAITQEQADRLLESPAFPRRLKFFEDGFHGRGSRGHHGRGFRGNPGGAFFDSGNDAPIIDAPADA